MFDVNEFVEANRWLKSWGEEDRAFFKKLLFDAITQDRQERGDVVGRLEKLGGPDRWWRCCEMGELVNAPEATILRMKENDPNNPYVNRYRPTIPEALEAAEKEESNDNG